MILRRRLLLLALSIGIAGCSSGDKVDPDFDTRVASPAYPADALDHVRERGFAGDYDAAALSLCNPALADLRFEA